MEESGFQRCRTGLKNLDIALDGGVPRNNFVIVAGSSGSGKTNLCIEFIYNGAAKFNEPGVYVTLEQTRDEILAAGNQIGKDFNSLIEKGLVSVISPSYYNLDRLFFTLEAEILRTGEVSSKRLVIDPVFFSEDTKQQIPFFKKLLRNMGCTTLVTLETAPGQTSGLSYADGIIELDSSSFLRNVRVGKMRGTSHDLGRYSMEITSKGVKVGERIEAPAKELLAESRV